MTTPTRFMKLRTDDQHLARVQDNIAAVVNPVATAVQSTPIMGAPPPAWIQYTLTSGYANVGGGLAVAAFHVDALGYLHSKGSLVCAAGSSAGDTIATLPMGKRPTEKLRLPVPVTAGAQWVTVAPDGTVATAFNIAAGDGIDLSFSFLVEQ